MTQRFMVKPTNNGSKMIPDGAGSFGDDELESATKETARPQLTEELLRAEARKVIDERWLFDE